jgi:TRAP-type C4-dicarboxylate transport system permease small subunit
MPQPDPAAWFERALRLLALLGGLVIVALMLFTVADVALRYLFGAPFRGSVEVTQFAMVLIVYLSLAWCGWTGGHVAVDVLAKWVDRPALRHVPAILALAAAMLFGLAAWQSFNQAVAAMQNGRLSNMLRWPQHPFRFAVAFGCAVFAAALVAQALHVLRRRA